VPVCPTAFHVMAQTSMPTQRCDTRCAQHSPDVSRGGGINSIFFTQYRSSLSMTTLCQSHAIHHGVFINRSRFYSNLCVDQPDQSQWGYNAIAATFAGLTSRNTRCIFAAFCMSSIRCNINCLTIGAECCRHADGEHSASSSTGSTRVTTYDLSC